MIAVEINRYCEDVSGRANDASLTALIQDYLLEFCINRAGGSGCLLSLELRSCGVLNQNDRMERAILLALALATLRCGDMESPITRQLFDDPSS